MNGWGRGLMGLFSLLWLGCTGAAQVASAAGEASLLFTLDRPGGAPPTHYSLRVNQATRQGRYSSQPATGGTDASSAGGTPIAISAEEARKLFAAVPLVRSNRCESHRKVAQTGVKTLEFEAGGAEATCTYNYSEDDRVNTATTIFEGLAETMQYGDRLAAKLRFDRLGLDTEMTGLESALADGRALEVVNIAPILRKIQADDEVIDLVRRKAAHLLQSAGVPGAADSEGAPRAQSPDAEAAFKR